jgi:RNA polymerase sigma-70 factor (ECF subfamily)
MQLLNDRDILDLPQIPAGNTIRVSAVCKESCAQTSDFSLLGIEPGGRECDVVDTPRLLDHFDNLYRYALFLARDQTEADDLVQETYARAFEKIKSIRNPNLLKHWLFKILRNAWLSELRNRRTILSEIDLDQTHSFANIVSAFEDAHSLLVRETEAAVVRNALLQLPAEARQIIVLREYDELSYREIAALLNCPVGTVMSRLGRARSKLRALLIKPLRLRAS